MALDTANALTTLALVKVFAGIGSTDTTYDTQLEQSIDAASWYIREQTGRKLVAQSLTEYYDGPRSDTLQLREYPIGSTIVMYSDAARSFGSGTLVDADDYEVYEEPGHVVLTGTGYDVGPRVIKVTYTGGYSTVPYDLSQACIELAVYWYEKFKNHRVGLSSVGGDGGTYSYQDMPPFVKAVIAKYRRRVVL